MKRFTAKYGIYIAFLLLAITMAVSSPYFLRTGNLLNILKQISINGIVAVGMTFVIISGGIDLSVGSIVALSAVFASTYAHPGDYSLFVPLVIGLLAGSACGFLNGVLIAKRRLPPFIVTLGMMTIARGVALVYSNGRPVINLSDQYNHIGGGYFFGLPIPAIIFLAVAAWGMLVLNYTKFGRHIYATGGNELAARISGVNTDQKKIIVYTMAGFFAGLAGIVLSSRIMTGSPVGGAGYELDAIAAVVIGGSSLKGGIGTIGGTIMGALIIGVISNGLDLLSVSSYWQQIVKGGIIVLAVMVDKNQGTDK
ncbi:MAG: ABC transporter permease [Ferruginibacter sp.]